MNVITSVYYAATQIKLISHCWQESSIECKFCYSIEFIVVAMIWNSKKAQGFIAFSGLIYIKLICKNPHDIFFSFNEILIYVGLCFLLTINYSNAIHYFNHFAATNTWQVLFQDRIYASILVKNAPSNPYQREKSHENKLFFRKKKSHVYIHVLGSWLWRS